MVIGFTGTRKGMSQDQKKKVRDLLLKKNPTKVLHGGCIGADEDFHNICVFLGFTIEIFPGHPLFKKYDTKYRANVIGDIVHEPKEFLKRNKEIVKNSDELIACPLDAKNTRGGTFHTMNYARTKNKTIHIFER